MSEAHENTWYYFVAEKAYKIGFPFTINCNCGANITFIPPIPKETLRCTKCGYLLRLLVIRGNSSHIVGQDDEGNPILYPIVGSPDPPLSEEEEKKFLKKVKEYLST